MLDSFHKSREMLTVVFIFTVAALLAAYFYLRAVVSPMMKLAEKIPGPKPLPLIGNALEFASKDDFHTAIIRLMRQYGSITRLWFGPHLVILMADPRHVEKLLGSNKMLDKAFTYRFLWSWLGQGLLTSSGEKWRSHRKLFTPTFHFKILEEFVEVMNSNERIMIQKMEKHLNGPEFDICPYVTLCALDIISETAMGVSIHAQLNSDSEYVQAVRKMGDVVMQRSFKPWTQPEFLFQFSSLAKVQKQSLQVLHNMTNSVIQTRKQQYLQSKEDGKTKEENSDIGIKRRLAFLDLLIQAQQDGFDLTDEEIREEVDTFMFEGHDTTTSGICFALFALAKHQDVQAKAVEELKSIFGDSDRDASLSDMQEMKYLEQVIKESQRVYPTVPMFGRRLTENVKFDDYEIPAESNLIVVTHVLHRHPDYFPDPERFDPDRFLLENLKGKHPYCHVPFSAGPRNCIGQKFAIMEMKAALSAMLRRYKLSLENPREEPEIIAEMVLKAARGIRLKLEPRHLSHNSSP